jgi:hypothetical protein
MECNSDLDSNSQSDYDPDHESTTGFDEEEADQLYNIEPEPNVPTHADEYESNWNHKDQLKAKVDAARLAQLHAGIKARAQVSTPTYQKLYRAWPPRPFDVRMLPNLVKDLIHYFELFWTSEVWNTLVQNTNAYAEY